MTISIKNNRKWESRSTSTFPLFVRMMIIWISLASFSAQQTQFGPRKVKEIQIGQSTDICSFASTGVNVNDFLQVSGWVKLRFGHNVIVGKYEVQDTMQFTLKPMFTGGLIPGTNDMANCWFSTSTSQWFFYTEIWKKNQGTGLLPCNLTRVIQSRTYVATQQCTSPTGLVRLLPFGLANDFIQSSSAQNIQMDSTRYEIKGAILSSALSDRAGNPNGDASFFLAGGLLYQKESIKFGRWPSVRDGYLLRKDRFATSDRVQKEYLLISEDGVDLIKVGNVSPSYYEIENIDVFNEQPTSRYAKNDYLGRCSTTISTLKIIPKQDGFIDDCPNNTCDQHYGLRYDLSFLDQAQYSSNPLLSPTLRFNLYFVCSHSTTNINQNQIGTWCYTGLENPPQNLAGNTTWRVQYPIAKDSYASLQFTIAICQQVDGVFLRAAANLRSFNPSHDQIAQTDTFVRTLEKKLPLSQAWPSVAHTLRIRAYLSSHKSLSSMSGQLGIFLTSFDFLGGAMVTELGFQIAGSAPNTSSEILIPNTNRLQSTYVCQFFGLSVGLDDMARKFSLCQLCPFTFVPVSNPLTEGDNCVSARNTQGCLHLQDSICHRCNSGFFVNMARTNSICTPVTNNCDNLNFNDINTNECLTCHTQHGCPCNRFQLENQLMTNGIYPTSSNSNRCVCPIDNCNPFNLSGQNLGKFCTENPCDQCQVNYYISQNLCVHENTIPEGWGINLLASRPNSFLVACLSSICELCQFDSSKCTKCADQKYLLVDANLNSTPSYSCFLESNFPPLTGKILNDPNREIRTCTTPFCSSCKDNYLQCMICQVGRYYFEKTNSCLLVSEIPEGYGINLSNSRIELCTKPNCSDCKVDNSICQSCKTGFLKVALVFPDQNIECWTLTLIQSTLDVGKFYSAPGIDSGQYSKCQQAYCLKCMLNAATCELCNQDYWELKVNAQSPVVECYEKATYIPVPFICQVPIGVLGNTKLNTIAYSTAFNKDCERCKFENITKCTKCMLNFYLVTDRNQSTTCRSTTLPIPERFGLDLPSYTPLKPGDQMSTLNTNVKACDHPDCLKCSQNNMVCIICDFAKRLFPKNTLTGVGCEFKEVIQSFYTLEQDLDYQSDSFLNFDLRFYSQIGQSADYLLLDRNTESSLFSCFVDYQGTYKDLVKSCIFKIADGLKPQLLLELDVQKIRETSSAISLEQGAKLKLVLVARNWGEPLVLLPSVPQLRILQEPAFSPKLIKNFKGNQEYYIENNFLNVEATVLKDQSSKIKKINDIGKILGWAIGVQVYSWEALYFLLSLFGQDQTGMLLKVSQIFTLILMLPFLNITRGLLLKEIFVQVRHIWYSSEPVSQIPDTYWDSRKKFSGSVSQYELMANRDFYFLGKCGLFYIFGIFLGITFLLHRRDRRKCITHPGRLRALYFLRRMNFATTCLILLDTVFYSSISIVKINLAHPDPVDALVITHLCFLILSFSLIIQQANNSHVNSQTDQVLRYYNEYLAFDKGQLVPTAKTAKLNQIIPEKPKVKTTGDETLDLSVFDAINNSSGIHSPQKNFSEGETKMSKNELSMADLLKKDQISPKPEDEWELEKKGFTKVIDIRASLCHADADQSSVIFSLNDITYKYDQLGKNKKSLEIGFIRMSNILGMMRLAVYICLIVSFQFMPLFAISLILATEISYLLTTMIYYCRESFIRSCYLATNKLVQSTLLVVLFFALFLIAIEAEKFNSQVSEDGQYAVLFSLAGLGCSELIMLVVSSCKLNSLYNRKKAADQVKSIELEGKLAPVQYRMMHITKMVEYLNEKKVKDCNDASLGQLEAIAHKLEKFKPIYMNLKGMESLEIPGVTDKKFSSLQANDSFMTHVNGPVVLNPRLVEIKKNYRFMEETNQQFTYKFKTANQSAKNKDLALQNFHILAFENKIGRNGLMQHQRPVFYTRDSRGDQISISDIQQLEPTQRNPKQPVREFRYQVAENLEDIGNTRGKFTGLDSSLSQIDISDYEDPVGYLNGQKYEKLQSRSQIYMGEKKST